MDSVVWISSNETMFAFRRPADQGGQQSESFYDDLRLFSVYHLVMTNIAMENHQS